ncbi:hypothetical protein AURDEDRAFT_115882 [Auricularia subglabra TFB-10046 SS5]|nr:hypothetical protein AURDEDRAFT_115882 [Auricularia subglabra TFB-10046 SS5]
MPAIAMNTDASRALQLSIQKELARLQYSESEDDPVMAEYITIMLINNKTPEQITAELTDLIGAEYDPAFTTWLFDEYAKVSGSEAPAVSSDGPSAEGGESQDAPQEIQTIQTHFDDSRSRGPARPNALFQQAVNGIPTVGQKRSSSMRSPSPSGERGPPQKSRRTELPTGPRAMRDDRPQRSLADRLGPPHPDAVQARINAVTGDPMMPPMHPGMMAPGMNPLQMQEMMAANMALMTHVAMNMGLVGPGGQFLHPGQPMNGQGFPPQGGFPPGGPAQRGRGAGPIARGRGRGRGGAVGGGHGAPNQPPADPASGPAPAPVALAPIAAPQPTHARPQAPAFTPPERPQSPSICKFGVKCTNAGCRYSHPSPVATAESGVVLSAEACEAGKDCKDKDCIKSHTSPAVANPSTAFVHKPAGRPAAPTAAPSPSRVPCKFGAACTRAGCMFQHPNPNAAKPCRFGSGCTRADCAFQHPPNRVLPGTFHRGLSTTTPIVSVPTPTFHNAAASPHKSVSFKPDPKAKEFVPGDGAGTPKSEEKQAPSVAA